MKSYLTLRRWGTTLVVCLVLASTVAPATTYYVDATGGSDSNDGTATDRAWKTLTQVTNAALLPGDSVLFKRDELWRDQLIISLSGTATDAITFATYGTGANPVFNGADVVTSWTSIGGNLYTATTTAEPDVVVFNGVKGKRETALSGVNAAYDWFWASDVLTIYSASAPTNMEVASRHFVIAVNTVSYVRVQDITVKYACDPVCLYETDHVTLSGLTVYDSASQGAIFAISYTAGRGEYNTVENCVAYNITGTAESLLSANDGCGIYFYGEMCKYNTISGCTVHHCGLEGIVILAGSYNLITNSTVYQSGESGFRIGLETCTGNVIEGNRSYENGQTVDDRFGIDLIRVGNDNLVRYNLVHDQHDTLNDPNIPGNDGNPKYGTGGIRFDGGNWEGHDHMGSTGNKAYYNVVYNETTGMESYNFSNIEFHNNAVCNTTVNGLGFVSASTTISSNNVAKNNIVYTASGVAFMRYQATQNAIDYNVYFSSGTTRFSWGGVPIDFDAWKTASQQDSHSQVADPLWVDRAGHDFHLQAASPAVDSGTDLGFTRDYDGVSAPQRGGFDAGAFELPAPTVTVTVPNGGETYVTGQTVPIAWTYAGDLGANVEIELLQGATSTVLAASVSAGSGEAGSWNWFIPLSQAAGTDYRVRVTSTSTPTSTDTSDADFTIVILPPRIAGILVEPDGTGKLLAGDSLRLILQMASGTPPFTLQWYKDGDAIPDATNITYELAQARVEDSGDYRCSAANPAGSDLSGSVTVTVVNPLAIIQHPQSADCRIRDAYTFTVVATGGFQPLTYEWKKQGIPATLGTDPNYTLTDLTFADAGDYYVIVTDDTGVVAQSNPAALTVHYGTPAAGSIALALLTMLILLAAARFLLQRMLA